MPTPAKTSADLADGVDRHVGRLQLLEVGARRRVQREVAAAGGALERPGLAGERPGDDAADGVLARMISRAVAHAACSSASLDHVLVRGDLQHGVRGRVDDQRAGAQVLGAVAPRAPRSPPSGALPRMSRPVARRSASMTSCGKPSG